MKFEEIEVEAAENFSDKYFEPYPSIRLLPGAKIIRSKMRGPAYLGRNVRIGPDTILGKYFGLNDNSTVVRADVGAFCAIGARVSINPFNHPIDWLSIHEFQYNPTSYDFVAEYNSVKRIARTPDAFARVTIGNDVWMGHNANVMSGINVGDGAVIAAGAVVTNDVPAYAIVAGVPATIKRYRFPEKIIERLLRSKWWDLELSQIGGLPFNDVARCLDTIERMKGL